MKNPFRPSAKAALEAAERHELTMREALEAATEAMVAAAEIRFAAVEAPDSELDKLDLAVQRAQIAQQRAMERHRAACDRVTEADAALEAEEAADRAKKAIALRGKIEPKVAEHYAESARGVLMLIQAIARADVELLTLEARPEGQSVASVEKATRLKSWLQETEVSRTEIELWTDRHGTVLERQPADSQISQDRDSHFIQADAGALGNSGKIEVQKRAFHQVEYRAGALNRRWLKPLYKQIVLPGVADSDAPLWPPGEGLANWSEGTAKQAEEALRRLDDQLKALQERRDDRPIKIRLEPVGQPNDVDDPDADEMGDRDE